MKGGTMPLSLIFEYPWQLRGGKTASRVLSELLPEWIRMRDESLAIFASAMGDHADSAL